MHSTQQCTAIRYADNSAACCHGRGAEQSEKGGFLGFLLFFSGI